MALFYIMNPQGCLETGPTGDIACFESWVAAVEDCTLGNLLVTDPDPVPGPYSVIVETDYGPMEIAVFRFVEAAYAANYWGITKEEQLLDLLDHYELPKFEPYQSYPGCPLGDSNTVVNPDGTQLRYVTGQGFVLEPWPE